ncbi:hypothetical protein [Cellulomonas septica]|uniref:Lipoprotein n=1 Tax=Cellulomonas septica TaxID=285080 RepID=A0ABX1K1M5_9CELL|nr:hypothetical protein [Cellulomonas septica]NKY40468.1 hypothetical protein [Cellulomonas septica]
MVTRPSARRAIPALLAACVLLVVPACQASTTGASPSSPAGDPTGSPSGSPSEPDDATPTVGPDRTVSWWQGEAGVQVDGVRALIPEGYHDGHLREGYAFLGYHEGGLVDWLTMVAPVQVSTAPPEETAELRPAPADIYAFLTESDPEAVEVLGSVDVDGTPAPVVRTDGDLTLCPQPGSPQPCRYNTAARFYVLVPYAGGTLVVEGESAVTAAGRTDDQVGQLLGELQEWAATVELP